MRTVHNNPLAGALNTVPATASHGVQWRELSRFNLPQGAKETTMLTIHKSANYAAHLLNSSGLIVESTRKPGGIQLRPDHPQYAAYVDAIRTAIDEKEGDSLCRALLN